MKETAQPMDATKRPRARHPFTESRGKWQIAGGILFVPLWLVTLAFGIRMILEGRKAIRYGRRLTTESVETTGVVVDRWTQWVRTKHQCIAYRFEVPAGDGTQRTIVRAESNPAAYQNYRVGMAVPVRHLPETPEICVITQPVIQTPA